MHLAVQTSEHIQKAKIRNMNIAIDKLNFTGKPFAPDTIFMGQLGKNLSIGDEAGKDFGQVNEVSSHRLSGEVDDGIDG